MKRAMKSIKFLVIVLVISFNCVVFGGDVVVQQGTLTTSGNSMVNGNLSVTGSAIITNGISGNLSVSGISTTSGTASFANGIDLTKNGDNAIKTTAINQQLSFKVNSGGTVRQPLCFLSSVYGTPCFDYYAPPLFSGGFYVCSTGVGTGYEDHWISDGSNSDSSCTLYIGNQVILTEEESDIKMKRNIVDTRVSIADLMNIQIKDYQYKPEYQKDSNTVHTGVIANDLKNIFPNSVKTGKRKVKAAVVEFDSNGKPIVIEPEIKEEILYVNYNDLVPVLIKSVQDLTRESDNLKAEIELLKQKIKTEQ